MNLFGDDHTYEEIIGQLQLSTRTILKEIHFMESMFLYVLNTGDCDWDEDCTMHEKNYAKN